MEAVLDTDGFGATAFASVAIAALVAWRYESVRSASIVDRHRRVLWPHFWLLLAVAYFAIALVLAADVVSTLGGIGREYARAEEWYESRRPFQVAAICVVAGAWLLTMIVGIWRVPERRRRYLPSALMLTTLVCFAVVRIISLHQVDTVFRRTQLGDVEVGTVVELIGIVVALGLVIVGVRRPIPGAAVDDVRGDEPTVEDQTPVAGGTRQRDG